MRFQQVSTASNQQTGSSSPLLKEDLRMRNKPLILLLLIHCFVVAAAAQNPAKRQLVMQVSNGGFVAFRSETPGAKSTPDSNSLAALLYSQAFAGTNRIIHRVLTDAQNNVVFGYDIWISSDPISKKFS